MQTSRMTALRERLVYYTSCLFSAQSREGEPYANLLPAISICFLGKTLFTETNEDHARFVL